MKLLGGTLYCEFSELLGFGVSEAYLWKVCSKARTGESRSWSNIPDPSDARRVLIAYDAIPTATLTAKNIPAKDALLTQLRAAEVAAASAARESAALGLLHYLEPITRHDLDALRGARTGREIADLATGEVRMRETTGLPADLLAVLVEQCRWLRLIGDARWKSKSNRQKVGFESLKELQLAAVAAADAVGVKLPTNYSKLQAKLRAYQQGPANLVPGGYGKQNARKVTEDVLEYLTGLYADARKPDYVRVHGWYEAARAQRADVGLPTWPELSVSAIKQNLMQPDVMPTWYLGRHGVDAWRAKFEYTVTRFRPTFRDALWVLDGTKVNYFYRKPGGKVAAKLNVVAVLDAHSDYLLGWAFGEQETGDVVMAALRMACERAGGLVPCQILSDNGGPNRRVAQGWHVGLWTLAQPNNGQSKVIEPVFGRLQDQVMRGHWAFTGQNITAKALDSRANDVLLDEAARTGQLWTLDEAMEQAERDMRAWNHLAQRKDGKTPHQRYHASQHPTAMRELTPADAADLFWAWNDRAIYYTRKGLEMTHRGQRHQYEVVDAAGVPDLDFVQRWGTAAFTVKYDPAAPATAVALYTADRRFVALAPAKRALPMAVADQQPGDRALVNTRLTVKKAQRADHEAKLGGIRERSAETDGTDADATVLRGHRWTSKDALDAAEEELLTARWKGTATTTADTPDAVPTDGALVAPEPDPNALATAKYARFLEAQRAAAADDWLTP